MKKGDYVRCTSDPGSPLAQIRYIHKDWARVLYIKARNIEWKLVENLKPITDGVANAAFNKPDDGEDCR